VRCELNAMATRYVLALLTAATLTVACGRPRQVTRTEQTPPSDATASAALPSEAPAQASASLPGAASPAAASPAGGALEAVTGDELLRRLRASGAKATLVNAWATWCGSCKRELPQLQEMAAKLAPRGVKILLVSVDEPEQLSEAREFLSARGITVPSVAAARPLGEFKAALNPRWPGMLPATFLFDAAGKLRYYWGGPAYENELMPIVEGLLAGKAIDGEADFTLAPGRVDQPGEGN